MQITGKITQVLPMQSGTTANGEWNKRQFIIETEGEYPKKVAILLFGKIATAIEPKVGQTAEVFYNPESREYNNNWYTDLKAWKVNLTGGESKPVNANNEPDTDLPF
jgi:hypothetical protein